MRDRPSDPRALDVASLCRDDATIAGVTPLADLPRLASTVLADADGGAAQVRWSARGSAEPVRGAAPALWLTLHAEVSVRLECQRCLQPLSLALTVDRPVRFVHGEDEAARLDDELEEDVLALEPRLDLIALLEDELILALPLVPRHGSCPQPLPLPAAEPEEPAPNPFAALARLRGTSS